MAELRQGWEVTESTFCHQGLNLACREWRHTDTAPGLFPVIALHGWMDNAGTFDALVPHLRWPWIIAPDFSGHGLSSHRGRDADYYIWLYVEELDSLLDHYELKRCHILAHSMGGAAACLFAALYPEKVATLTLLDIAGPIVTTEKELPAQMRKAIAEKKGITTRKIRHYPSLEAAVTARANRGISLEAARILGKRGISQDDQGWYWSVDRQLSRRHLVSLSEEQCQAFLKSVTSPCLAITARETWAHRKAFLDSRLGLFRQLEWRELDGSHFQHLEGNVSEVAQLVQGFLDRSC